MYFVTTPYVIHVPVVKNYSKFISRVFNLIVSQE